MPFTIKWIAALLISLSLTLYNASFARAGVLFDGTNDCLFSAGTVDFSADVITVSFWSYWDSFANDDDLLLELSANSNLNNPTIQINPNTTGFSSGTWNTLIHGSVGYRIESITRPSGAVWHHYAIVYNNTTANGDIKIYLNGTEQSTTVELNTKTDTGNFKTDTLYLMSRACASLFADGRLSDLSIHKVELTATEIALMAGSKVKGIAYQIQPSNLLLYLPLDECSDGAACTTASGFRDRKGANNFSPTNSPTGSAEAVLTYP